MRLEEQTIFADLAGEVAKGFRRIDLLNAPDEEVGPLVRWAATTPLPPDWKHNRHIFERYTQFGDPRALAIHRLRHLSAVHDWLVRLTTASRVRGRLRPSTTGRWYPHHVELAAVPKHSVEGLRLRGHLVPPPGEVFVAGDYQAFEPHILAHEIQDPSLVQACATGDCYENLAPHLGLTPADRSIVKKAMLALTYRITPDSFTASLPMPLADGHRLYRKLERHLTKTIAFRKKFGAEARRSGEARSLWGWRRRWQPGVGPQAFERKAFNLLAQGSAADILRALLRALHAVLPPGVAIVHQEFDAVILRCPAELAPKVAADLKQTMEHIAPLRVQLKARIKIGPTLAAVS